MVSNGHIDGDTTTVSHSDLYAYQHSGANEYAYAH
jgi:hypothetical protein